MQLPNIQFRTRAARGNPAAIAARERETPAAALTITGAARLPSARNVVRESARRGRGQWWARLSRFSGCEEWLARGPERRSRLCGHGASLE